MLFSGKLENIVVLLSPEPEYLLVDNILNWRGFSQT